VERKKKLKLTGIIHYNYNACHLLVCHPSSQTSCFHATHFLNGVRHAVVQGTVQSTALSNQEFICSVP